MQHPGYPQRSGGIAHAPLPDTLTEKSLTEK
jgi:hypothetical protein